MKYPLKKHHSVDESSDQIAEAAVEYQVQPLGAASGIANIDTEALGLTGTKGNVNLEQELSKLQKEYQQAKLQLLKRHKNAQQANQVASLLDMLGDFDDEPSITRLELIRRYSVLRKQVRHKVEFVGAKELAKLLDENKANWTRDLANLYKKNKLLAIRRLGSSNWEYPLNQIDPVQGAVYPNLEAVIGDFKTHGLSDWDILIWLNLPSNIEQDADPVLINENDDLDSLLADFDARQAPQPLTQVVPMELLQQGKTEMFHHQAERFLHPQLGG